MIKESEINHIYGFSTLLKMFGISPHFYSANVMRHCICDNVKQNYNKCIIILQYMYCDSMKDP